VYVGSTVSGADGMQDPSMGPVVHSFGQTSNDGDGEKGSLKKRMVGDGNTTHTTHDKGSHGVVGGGGDGDGDSEEGSVVRTNPVSVTKKPKPLSEAGMRLAAQRAIREKERKVLADMNAFRDGIGFSQDVQHLLAMERNDCRKHLDFMFQAEGNLIMVLREQTAADKLYGDKRLEDLTRGKSVQEVQDTMHRVIGSRVAAVEAARVRYELHSNTVGLILDAACRRIVGARPDLRDPVRYVHAEPRREALGVPIPEGVEVPAGLAELCATDSVTRIKELELRVKELEGEVAQQRQRIAELNKDKAGVKSDDGSGSGSGPGVDLERHTKASV
jgi:hypothetical protein